MTDFKAKMHRIRFRLGLRLWPRWGSLQHSPRPTSWIWVPLRGRGGAGLGKRREGEGKERERKWRGGKGRDPNYCWTRAPQSLATLLSVFEMTVYLLTYLLTSPIQTFSRKLKSFASAR